MANPPDTKNLVSLTAQEHIGPDSSGDNIGAKRVANYIWDPALGVAGEWKRDEGSSGGGTVDQGTAGADPWLVEVVSDTFTKKTVTASTSGNTTLHTPASGKKVRLYFFGYSAGADILGNLVALKFTTGGTVFDRQYLIAPGQPYARNIQAGKRYIDGGVDEALVVNLSAAETVYINLELEEVS